MIAVAQVIIEENEKRFRLSRSGGEVFLIGAVWQPVTPFSSFPDSFAILEAPTSEDLSRALTRAPFPVYGRKLEGWLDHRRDKAAAHERVPAFYDWEELDL